MPPRSSASLRLWNTRGHCYNLACRSLVRPVNLTAVAPVRSVLPRHISYRFRLPPSPSIGRRPFCQSCRTSFSAGTVTMGSIERITENLEKPELDDRSYRVIRLENKLEALLVHDPDTDKASAAVNVNVGNFSDYDDTPGMAHAVEHLLFMGTKKVCRIVFCPCFFPWLNKQCWCSSPKRMPTTNISHLIRDPQMPILLQQRQTTSLRCLLHRLMSLRTVIPPQMDLLTVLPTALSQSRMELASLRTPEHRLFMELSTVSHNSLCHRCSWSRPSIVS